MTGQSRYRILLPVIQSIAVLLFGGAGLLQRHTILNHRFIGEQTMWDTTARFHVWPLPYRFAVITNIPAFLAAGILERPLAAVWPRMPEVVGFLLFVSCVPVIWHILGRRIDSRPSEGNRYRNIFLLFAVLSVMAVFTPGYVGYFYSGIVLWIAFVVVALRVRTGTQ